MPTMPDLQTDLTKTAKAVAGKAKDAAYVVVGAGVMGFQQAQVQRQEFGKRLAEPRKSVVERIESVRSDVTGAILALDINVDQLFERVETAIERMEQTIAPLENKLPSPARDLSQQARSQAKAARAQVRSFIPASGSTPEA